MASVSNDGNGRRRIQFFGLDGKRKSLRLGKVTTKEANEVREKIEGLIGMRTTQIPDAEVNAWLVKLPDDRYQKIVAVGLAEPREPAEPAPSAISLQELLDSYFANLDAKPITILGYQPTKAALLEYFGPSTPIDTITPLQAAEWRSKMKADGLAEATISKRIMVARHMFHCAVDWEKIGRNPFAKVKAGSQKNKAREFDVTREMANAVMDACPGCPVASIVRPEPLRWAALPV